MADGILPAATVLAVKGKVVHNVIVDLVQRQLLLGGAFDGHGDERDVGERRALVHLHHLLSLAYDASEQRESQRAGRVYSAEQRRCRSNRSSCEHLQAAGQPGQQGGGIRIDCKLHIYRF